MRYVLSAGLYREIFHFEQIFKFSGPYSVPAKLTKRSARTNREKIYEIYVGHTVSFRFPLLNA